MDRADAKERQKNLPRFAFVFNLSDGKAKSLQRSGDAWLFFHLETYLEFGLTSEARLSFRDFLPKCQRMSKVIMGSLLFGCGISLDLSGFSEGYEVFIAIQIFMTE